MKYFTVLNSPGNDGLISEFHKYFQKELSHLLLAVFKEAIQQGYLPNSLKQGLITLLPKPKKDVFFLENWRPVTLINNDENIFACIFAERLIIDECQSGFMKGRHISNNIRLILQLIDYNECITDNSCILFVI